MEKVVEDLDIVVRETNGSVDIVMHGTIDLSTADHFETAVRAAVAATHAAVNLDLQEVGFMDSTGLKVLVQSRQAALEKGIKIEIVKASRRVRRLLELTSLDDFLS